MKRYKKDTERCLDPNGGLPMKNSYKRASSITSPYVFSLGYGNGGYVMAVDDEEYFLHEYCSSSTTEVEFAGISNPTRVLNELAKRTPDVMLVDLEMSYLDGAQLLRAIRREGYTFPIVMAVPPGFPEESRMMCLRWGASEVVEKPLTSTKFMAIVGPYLKTERK
jgi:DNA-binding response OmpR family regulator